jgi:pimeloyl-ACP methyl ester carboxylesterase
MNYKQLSIKNLFFSLLLFLCTVGYCQTNTTIYLFPGQGSDKRIFDSLTFDTSYSIVNIDYGMPPKGCSLHDFALLLSKQIDTTKPSILIGVSMGGMICSELSDIIPTEKVILISSAKFRDELPFGYRFQKYIPIYKVFPAPLLRIGALVAQPIVEPDRNTCKSTFRSMISAKKPQYIKRTIHMIITWDKKTYNPKIIHIHGSADNTLPIKHISPNYIITNGSHMMCLTRGGEINLLIQNILRK